MPSLLTQSIGPAVSSVQTQTNPTVQAVRAQEALSSIPVSVEASQRLAARSAIRPLSDKERSVQREKRVEGTFETKKDEEIAPRKKGDGKLDVIA